MTSTASDSGSPAANTKSRLVHLHSTPNEINNDSGGGSTSLTSTTGTRTPTKTTSAFPSTSSEDMVPIVKEEVAHNIPVFENRGQTVTVRENDTVNLHCRVRDLGKSGRHSHDYYISSRHVQVYM